MYEKNDGFKEEDVHEKADPNAELVMIAGCFYCRECGFSIFEKSYPPTLSQEDIQSLLETPTTPPPQQSVMPKETGP